MQYKVKLKTFEGPLDLLLHLIKQNDLDLYDIPVKEITDQYMVYIRTMQVLHLDIASEYLVMAATLLYMKSKLLLPVERDEFDDEEIEYEDGEQMREDLMRRLIEYKKYKEAASELKDRERERSELFSKPMSDLTPFLKEDSDLPRMNVTIYDMLKAFQRIKKRKESMRPMYTKVQKEEIPIDAKMEQIMNYVRRKAGRCFFSELFHRQEKYELVVSFLALLELIKEDEIVCYQEKNFEDIMIYEKEAYERAKSTD